MKNNYLFFEQEIGHITPTIADFIDLYEKELSPEYVHDAIYEATKHNARTMAYVKKILDTWKREGKKNNPQRLNAAPTMSWDILPDGSRVAVEVSHA
jgi:DnaD/phage-associated family protein